MGMGDGGSYGTSETSGPPGPKLNWQTYRRLFFQNYNDNTPRSESWADDIWPRCSAGCCFFLHVVDIQFGSYSTDTISNADGT